MRPILDQIHILDEEELLTLKKRVELTIIIMVTFIAILVVRLWYLQIHEGEKYANLAHNNRVRQLQIAAPRGNILDRHNRIIISNRPLFNILWTRDDAENPDLVLKKMSRILKEDISDILDRIRDEGNQPNFIPIPLKEDVDWETVAFVENHRLELPGIRIEAVPSRKYNYGNLASHLIGYLGEISKNELETKNRAFYMGGDLIGKMGLEKIFEKQLKGEKGQRFFEVDVHGMEQQPLKLTEPLPGNDLQLTLDLDLQQIAEKEMAGKAGAVVAMDVKTGRLLVLLSAPALHLEEFIGGITQKSWDKMMHDPLKPLLDKTIQGQYPPGSTYKIVTALAGLMEGIITPETTFSCFGSFTLHGHQYGCWKKWGHGRDVNLQRALAESCDVYFYHIGQEIGVDKLAIYAKSLGLGERTGIILENEKTGLVPTKDWKRRKRNEPWQQGETVSVSIGQGFNLATPLQISLMTAAIANGGTLYQPQLVLAVKDQDGVTLEEFPPIETGRAFATQKEIKLIQKGLEAAVNSPHGTGEKAKMKSVTVAGKTGTAQVVRLEQFAETEVEDVPYKYRDHAWFTCYAPAENPEIVVTVLTEHGGHGGSAAAPIAKAVLEEYFKNKSSEIRAQK
ncbi:MAG: penicillin-binding protein 2 [Proteobacteria bacterium]|nr:penicillin-binding protein 2 [Pseudomonadota bacterium]MBU1639114.1 penicillin-binding protein 2 [Pseudomonadota bacterium]